MRFDGETWYAFSEPNPVEREGSQRPAGPDRAKLRRYSEAGWDVAYRPVNYPNLIDVGRDFPEVGYLIHEGLEVVGNPDALSQTVAASQPYLTGVIEGTVQAGMSAIVHKVPMARTFSVSQEWLNTLEPQEVADKYMPRRRRTRGAAPLPAALHRRHRRRYGSEYRGAYSGGERWARGRRLSYRPGRSLSYSSPLVLRLMAGLGILAGLGPLATLYPGSGACWSRLASRPRRSGGRREPGRAGTRRGAELSACSVTPCFPTSSGASSAQLG